jgi:hypothetical protein
LQRPAAVRCCAQVLKKAVLRNYKPAFGLRTSPRFVHRPSTARDTIRRRQNCLVTEIKRYVGGYLLMLLLRSDSDAIYSKITKSWQMRGDPGFGTLNVGCLSTQLRLTPVPGQSPFVYGIYRSAFEETPNLLWHERALCSIQMAWLWADPRNLFLENSDPQLRITLVCSLTSGGCILLRKSRLARRRQNYAVQRPQQAV